MEKEGTRAKFLSWRFHRIPWKKPWYETLLSQQCFWILRFLNFLSGLWKFRLALWKFRIYVMENLICITKNFDMYVVDPMLFEGMKETHNVPKMVLQK